MDNVGYKQVGPLKDRGTWGVFGKMELLNGRWGTVGEHGA